MAGRYKHPMATPFEGFDLAGFWEDSEYARKTYLEVPLTHGLVAEIEAQLGVRLPPSYLALMRSQNGGIPRSRCHSTSTPTTWAPDHIAISGIWGVGRNKLRSLGGGFGGRFMQEEWGYPDLGVCICDCPSAGHDIVMLDYRACGPQGEPSVVHVDQEDGYAVTFLAKDFETFVRGLVHERMFATPDGKR